MHGIIFEQLRQFIFSTVNAQIWQQALTKFGIEKLGIDPEESHEDQFFEDLIQHLILLSGKDKEDFLVEFGIYLVPTLMTFYNLNQENKLLEILIKAEETLNSTIRKNFLESEPINLSVIKINTRRAEIIYSSRFEMPEIAIGIIQGLGYHFKEKTSIEYHLLADGNHLITVETF